MPRPPGLFRPMDTLTDEPKRRHTDDVGLHRKQKTYGRARGDAMRSNFPHSAKHVQSAEKQSYSKKHHIDDMDAVEDTDADELGAQLGSLPPKRTRTKGPSIDLTAEPEVSRNIRQSFQPREYLEVESRLNSNDYAEWKGPEEKPQSEQRAPARTLAGSVYDGPIEMMHTQSMGLTSRVTRGQARKSGPTGSTQGEKTHSNPDHRTTKLSRVNAPPVERLAKYQGDVRGIPNKSMASENQDHSYQRPLRTSSTSPALVKMQRPKNGLKHHDRARDSRRCSTRDETPQLFRVKYINLNGSPIHDSVSAYLDGPCRLKFIGGATDFRHSIEITKTIVADVSDSHNCMIAIKKNGPFSASADFALENYEEFRKLCSALSKSAGQLNRRSENWMEEVRDRRRKETGDRSMRSAKPPISDEQAIPNWTDDETHELSAGERGLPLQHRGATGMIQRKGDTKESRNITLPWAKQAPVTRQSARFQESRELSTNNSLQQGLVESMSASTKTKTPPVSLAWKRPLVYPPTGKRRATVEYDDLQRLEEGEFLNDNLIWFYLRHLMAKVEDNHPAVSQKIYWFNSYFFERLTSEPRQKSGINYEAVRRWTKDVDLFAYDYIVIPVNESAHWYVVIVCNLALKFEQPNSDRPSDVYEVGSSPTNPIGIDGSQKDTGKLETWELAHSPNNIAESDPNLPVAPQSHGIRGAEMVMIQHSSPSRYATRSTYDTSNDPEFVHAGDTNDRQVTHDYRHKDKFEPTQRNYLDRASLGSLRQNSVSKKKKRPSGRVYDPNSPAIITLDSLGLTHPQTTKFLKLYIVQEAEEKKGHMPFELSDIQGINAKGIPQQDNFCDCGLYVIQYMEKFVKDPREFVTKLLRRQTDIDTDWHDLDPSQKRMFIKNLIKKLYREQVERKRQLICRSVQTFDSEPDVHRAPAGVSKSGKNEIASKATTVAVPKVMEESFNAGPPKMDPSGNDAVLLQESALPTFVTIEEQRLHMDNNIVADGQPSRGRRDLRNEEITPDNTILHGTESYSANTNLTKGLEDPSVDSFAPSDGSAKGHLGLIGQLEAAIKNSDADGEEVAAINTREISSSEPDVDNKKRVDHEAHIIVDKLL